MATRRVLFAATALAAAAADQAGKAWALATRSGSPDADPRLGPVQVRLTRNPGAALGLGHEFTVAITLFTVAALVVLAILGWRAHGRAWALALGLIAGGALGNGVDRFTRAPGPLRGAVVDWIKLSFYGPVFNLADVSLRTGLLVAVVLLLRRRPLALPSGEQAG